MESGGSLFELGIVMSLEVKNRLRSKIFKTGFIFFCLLILSGLILTFFLYLKVQNYLSAMTCNMYGVVLVENF